jgi:hypothetical protein
VCPRIGISFPNLKGKIVEICEGISGATSLRCRDFSYLLSRAPQMKEEVLRKIAWASQHIFSARAWCVGQKIVLCRRGQELESPLISQLRRLDTVLRRLISPMFSRGWGETQKQDRLDALLLNAKQDTVYLVKGASYSQARKYSPELTVNVDRTSLFGNDGRFLSHPFGAFPTRWHAYFSPATSRASFPDLR